MKMYVFASGSKGNASLIYNDKTSILIDDGLSLSSLESNLKDVDKNIKDIDAILITHNHSDHISGLKFLKNKKIYCLSNIYNDLFPKLKENTIIPFNLEDKLQIGDFNIEILKTYHDALDSCGFLINENYTSLVYITDTGKLTKKILNKIKNKNYYFIESNHDIKMLLESKRPKFLIDRIKSNHGHLSNEQCGTYLSKIIGDKTCKICLAHLSQDCNNEELALNAVLSILENNNFANYKDKIMCARQFEGRFFIC